MSGREEHAADRRALPDFPPEWGTPPGTPSSEVRSRWIMANVRRMESDPHRKLARAEIRLLNDLRLALVAQAEGRDLG